MFSSDLLLRESAQCPDSDEAKFQAPPHISPISPYISLYLPISPCISLYLQDVNRHQFFNTNNLWIDLEALKVLP